MNLENDFIGFINIDDDLDENVLVEDKVSSDEDPPMLDNKKWGGYKNGMGEE